MGILNGTLNLVLRCESVLGQSAFRKLAETVCVEPVDLATLSEVEVNAPRWSIDSTTEAMLEVAESAGQGAHLRDLHSRPLEVAGWPRKSGILKHLHGGCNPLLIVEYQFFKSWVHVRPGLAATTKCLHASPSEASRVGQLHC